jgi:hypothetical protein
VSPAEQGATKGMRPACWSAWWPSFVALVLRNNVLGPVQHRMGIAVAFNSDSIALTGCITAVSLSLGPIGQNFTVSVTEACARRPGAAASVSRRRRERRTLLAGGGLAAGERAVATRLRQARPLSARIRFFAIG